MADPDLESLERALRTALRPESPEATFADRVLQRLQDDAAEASASGPAAPRPRWGWRWLAPALAACLIAAFGLVHWHRLQRGRALRARTQVTQALLIASENVNAVRTAVLEEEQESTP